MPTIKAYVNTSDRRVVTKTITQIGADISAVFKGEADIMNPVIELAYNSSLLTCNYVYIDVFARYYYVTKIITGSQRITMELKDDVLMSHASEIRGMDAYLARVEKNHFNKYLRDRAFKTLSYRVVKTIPFPKSFEKDMEFVLTVAGGE